MQRRTPSRLGFVEATCWVNSTSDAPWREICVARRELVAIEERVVDTIDEVTLHQLRVDLARRHTRRKHFSRVVHCEDVRQITIVVARQAHGPVEAGVARGHLQQDELPQEGGRDRVAVRNLNRHHIAE